MLVAKTLVMSDAIDNALYLVKSTSEMLFSKCVTINVNVSVATDEGLSLKLALSKGGSRENVKVSCEYDSNSAT